MIFVQIVASNSVGFFVVMVIVNLFVSVNLLDIFMS